MSESRKLPVDFSKKVKQSPPVGGVGYPYQISAADLMANFNYLLKESGMPEGYLINEMLYFDGTNWTILAAPPETGTVVLACVNGSLQWLATEECV